MQSFHEGNREVWNRTARGGYGADISGDVAFLRAGKSSLLPPELDLLGQISGRVIHLQCSHGLDGLSLLNMGADEVVGIDISEQMLEYAQEKSESLGANATWLRADVLDTPHEFDGTADVVYTGKGAICWLMDLDAWAAVVARLLRPGGKLCLFEGHPLDFLWNEHAEKLELRDGSNYFSSGPKAERGFPYEAAMRVEPSEVANLTSRTWTVGQVVTATVGAGLHIKRLEEYPEPFWDQFKHIPRDELHRLPHTYGLLAEKL